MGTVFKNAARFNDDVWFGQGFANRFQVFQDLMRTRIRDVLLVSSLYDLYVLEEDGRLFELIRDKYLGLNLSNSPDITRVSNGEEAIALAKDRKFDLIITTMHVEDMHAELFAQKVRQELPDLPIVLMAFDNRELSDVLAQNHYKSFNQIFIWQGDYRLLLAIIKYFEDRLNVDHDTNLVGVQSIIVIEDNVRFYSSYLPIIYQEVMNLSQRLISEGINLSHKQLRQRARPKILLCTNYEEAWDYFAKYKENVLGIISDINFSHNGEMDDHAGIEFAQNVLKLYPDIPILLQSTNQDNEPAANNIGASFLLKGSPTLLHDLRYFLLRNLSFGDFVFSDAEGKQYGTAHDLRSLEKSVKKLPIETITYHAARNHFSNWLKARTEFWLAHQLRPQKQADYENEEDLRHDLYMAIHNYRRMQQRGIITDFDKESFDPNNSISRIGEGSLGGKARGLSFVNILLNNHNIDDSFADVHIFVPPSLFLGTGIFDQFLDDNDLYEFALETDDDDLIVDRFNNADYFPLDVQEDLRDFLEIVTTPLAVRSSSLLEDSHNQPFAGVYKTYMLPNGNPDPEIRLQELVLAIKKVYASTYFKASKEYFNATSYRLEEEKMAVIIQKMVGKVHREKFYPDMAGVARSYNFYPIPPQKADDGIISAAFGLGKMVVEGGNAVRFSPKHPTRTDQLSSLKNTIKNAQNNFYALDLVDSFKNACNKDDWFVKKYPLKAAEDDGTLYHVASTYSPENDSLYDGISRNGLRLITFAPLLKNKLFPIADISEMLLDICSWGMGVPVEIEFAANWNVSQNERKEFCVLQVRPMVLNRELEVLSIEDIDDNELLCRSNSVLGNGVLQDICDIVFVDREKFKRSNSKIVADEIAQINHQLVSEKRPFLLVGVGRWGSLDPFLGIPVTWEQISGAKAIVECSFKDMTVEPSQGSHFFQNLNSFMIGYFTIHSAKDGFLDWEWLKTLPVEKSMEYTSLAHTEQPITIKMNGHLGKGIIKKTSD